MYWAIWGMWQAANWMWRRDIKDCLSCLAAAQNTSRHTDMCSIGHCAMDIQETKHGPQLTPCYTAINIVEQAYGSRYCCCWRITTSILWQGSGIWRVSKFRAHSDTEAWSTVLVQNILSSPKHHIDCIGANSYILLWEQHFSTWAYIDSKKYLTIATWSPSLCAT